MMARGTRLTIDLGNEDFLKEVKIADVQESKSIRGVVVEALEEWLNIRRVKEDEEDLKVMSEAEAEYNLTGGRPFEDVVDELGQQA